MIYGHGAHSGSCITCGEKTTGRWEDNRYQCLEHLTDKQVLDNNMARIQAGIFELLIRKVLTTPTN